MVCPSQVTLSSVTLCCAFSVAVWIPKTNGVDKKGPESFVPGLRLPLVLRRRLESPNEG